MQITHSPPLEAVKPHSVNYYPLFDGLRITLAILVALSHDGIIRWPHAGNLAVQCFFSLSGWLIGGILLKSPVHDLPRFFFNRATRIWIPYGIAIALLLGASLLRDPISPKWVEFAFYKITFVYNLFGPPQLASFRAQMPLAGTGNHFWSICTEEQFYLLAPLLIVLLPARLGKSPAVWSTLSILAIFFQIFGAIALGVTAAVIAHRYGNRHLDKRAISFLVALILGTSTMILFEVFDYAFVAPIFALSVVLLLARPGVASAFGRFWGGVSYPFYLNHWIGVFVANELFEPYGLRESLYRKMAALLINLAVAAALYVTVDETIRKHRDKWYRQARGVSLAVTAYGLLAFGLIGGLAYFPR